MTLFYPSTSRRDLGNNDTRSSSLPSSCEREYAIHINKGYNRMTYDDLNYRLDEYPKSGDNFRRTVTAHKETESRSDNSERDDYFTIFEIEDDFTKLTLTGKNDDSTTETNNDGNIQQNLNNAQSDESITNTDNDNIVNYDSDTGNTDFINCDANSLENNISALDTKSVKNVRFADDNDEDLVEIRTFLPTPPHALFFSPELFLHNFLQFRNQMPSKQTSQYMRQQQQQQLQRQQQLYCKPKTSKLKLCFDDPCTDSKKINSVVFLSKYSTTNRMMTGIVLVKNLEFEKRVFVRYTVDGWKCHSDLEAFYITNTEDGLFDRFSFTLTLPSSAKCLEFAICYKTPSTEYWDNNDGENYRVEEERCE